jgi:hypothetical protein
VNYVTTARTAWTPTADQHKRALLPQSRTKRELSDKVTALLMLGGAMCFGSGAV